MPVPSPLSTEANVLQGLKPTQAATPLATMPKNAGLAITTVSQLVAIQQATEQITTVRQMGLAQAKAANHPDLAQGRDALLMAVTQYGVASPAALQINLFQ